MAWLSRGRDLLLCALVLPVLSTRVECQARPDQAPVHGVKVTAAIAFEDFFAGPYQNSAAAGVEVAVARRAGKGWFLGAGFRTVTREDAVQSVGFKSIFGQFMWQLFYLYASISMEDQINCYWINFSYTSKFKIIQEKNRSKKYGKTVNIFQ